MTRQHISPRPTTLDFNQLSESLSKIQNIISHSRRSCRSLPNIFSSSVLQRHVEVELAYRLCTMVEDLLHDTPYSSFSSTWVSMNKNGRNREFLKFWNETKEKSNKNKLNFLSYLDSLAELDAVSSNPRFDIWEPINN